VTILGEGASVIQLMLGDGVFHLALLDAQTDLCSRLVKEIERASTTPLFGKLQLFGLFKGVLLPQRWGVNYKSLPVGRPQHRA
jgi:hypothetical protein